MRWKTMLWFTASLIGANALHLTIENELNIYESQHMHEEDSILVTGPPSEEYPSTSSYINYVPSTKQYTATNVDQTSVDNDDTSTESSSTTTAHISPTVSYENYTADDTDYVSVDQTVSGEVTSRDSTINIETVTTERLDIEHTETVTTERLDMESYPDTARSNEVSPGYSNEELEVTDGGEQNFIVQTSNGAVRGFEWNAIPNIIGYIDIPYGVFVGYFQDPTCAEPWDNIYENREHSKRCPQLQDETYVGDLDCLTLSIFKPLNANNASVLFHIHDSNFTSGSGDPSLYGPDYLVAKGIILVLPNYRLGPLGFLCLRNETAPGNAALKDLTLALSWIKENIAAFGGNPSNIVVSGDGTSGALAGYLALSSKSKDYITKVITETGSVLSHWAFDRNPGANAEVLAERIRERSSLYNITFEEADVETIVRAGKNIQFKPCLEHNDHPFMKNTPWETLHEEKINIPFMVGTANYAGTREAVNQTEASIAQLNENFAEFLPGDLHFDSCEEKNNIGNQVRKQYFGETNISLEHVDELSLCFTDAYYLGPGIRTARPLVQAGAIVYLYEFAFVGELNRELHSMDKPVEGAVRGDIIGYLFAQDGMKPEDDTEEKRMVDLMIDLWISFIEHGKPLADDINWNSLNKTDKPEEEEWLSISSEVALKRGLHMDRLDLWTHIYNNHFIEHNNANRRRPSIYVLFVVLILFWICFCKNITRM